MTLDRSVRGYVGIGVYHPKTGINIGTLFRSARAFGADFVFTIGRRYQRQSSAMKCERHLPVLHFDTAESWRKAMPNDARLVAVEIAEKAKPIEDFLHPSRAIYLLGPEDGSLPPEFMKGCEVIQIPTTYCLNVASAGTVVLYDRVAKQNSGLRRPKGE